MVWVPTILPRGCNSGIPQEEQELTRGLSLQNTILDRLFLGVCGISAVSEEPPRLNLMKDWYFAPWSSRPSK